jgi:hypothetical protein
MIHRPILRIAALALAAAVATACSDSERSPAGQKDARGAASDARAQADGPLTRDTAAPSGVVADGAAVVEAGAIDARAIAGAMAVPRGMRPTLLSTTSLGTVDSWTDGAWVAWVAKTAAEGNSQIFAQQADRPLAPRTITPAEGWIDGGDSLWQVVVADGLAVWRGWNGSSYRIYAYDLNAASPVVVDLSGASPGVDDFHTRGRVVVWVSGSSPSFTIHIFRFDYQTLTTIPVTAKDTDPYPKTDGRFVVWMAGPWPSFDIYAYDLQAAAPAPLPLTTGGWNAQPVVDDGIVAWYRDAGAGNYEIYFADAKQASPSAVRVTNNAVADEHPQLDGGVIVWSASDGSDSEIYGYDTRASSPSIVALTNNTTSDGDWPSIPRISDGLVVWSGTVTGASGQEVFYCDLRAATPQPIRLTNNALDDVRPRVAHGVISWNAGGATYAARR